MASKKRQAVVSEEVSQGPQLREGEECFAVYFFSAFFLRCPATRVATHLPERC